MADPKANPLMFSGNAADMLKQYGQAVPEQQPMSSLEDAQAAKAKMEAEKEPEAHFHDGHACTADHSSEHTHDKGEHSHESHGHKEHSHESHGHKGPRSLGARPQGARPQRVLRRPRARVARPQGERSRPRVEPRPLQVRR